MNTNTKKEIEVLSETSGEEIRYKYCFDTILDRIGGGN